MGHVIGLREGRLVRPSNFMRGFKVKFLSDGRVAVSEGLQGEAIECRTIEAALLFLEEFTESMPIHLTVYGADGVELVFGPFHSSKHSRLEKAEMWRVQPG